MSSDSSNEDVDVEALSGESWTQTNVTVTPEDDEVYREIPPSVITSKRGNEPLELLTIRARSTKNLIGPDEGLEPQLDIKKVAPREYLEVDLAETQTYLQGVPKMSLPDEFRDEATQTLFMGRHFGGSKDSPAMTDIEKFMMSTNERTMPTFKSNKLAQTMVACPPSLGWEDVIEKLQTKIKERDLKLLFGLTYREELELEFGDILCFVTCRALWIVDPENCPYSLTTEDKSTQTAIRINMKMNTVVIDGDTQTRLALEPKKSNSNLLNDYLEDRAYVANILESTMENAISGRVIVDEFMEDLVERCATFVKVLTRDNFTQTYAQCSIRCVKDDDFLKCLEEPVDLETAEIENFMAQVVEDVWQRADEEILRETDENFRMLLNRTVDDAVVRAERIETIKNGVVAEVPIDKVLEMRRNMLAESLRGKQKQIDASSTQTGVTGVNEVRLLQDSEPEPEEAVCEVCGECGAYECCNFELDDEGTPVVLSKALNTRDILFAYKPCYKVGKPPEMRKSLLPWYRQKQQANSVEEESEDNSSVSTVPCAINKIEYKESVTGWSHVVKTTPSFDSIKTCNVKRKFSEDSLDPKTENALTALKSAFYRDNREDLSRQPSTCSQRKFEDCICFDDLDTEDLSYGDFDVRQCGLSCKPNCLREFSMEDFLIN